VRGILKGASVTSTIKESFTFNQRRPRTAKFSKVQEMLMQQVAQPFRNINELSQDKLVAILHSDLLKRGKVVSKKSSRDVECFLFDFGSTVKVPIDQIFAVSESYFEISERRFEAKLSEIEPSFLKCPHGKWTSQAVEVFRSFALNRDAKVEVYSIVGTTASVKLWIEDLCVNEELIEAEFAQECEENFPSKHNHQMRMKIQALSTGRKFPTECSLYTFRHLQSQNATRS
jgi:Tudor domain